MEETQELEILISPQAGPQTVFLTTGADIAIYGGAAGGGKTWSLLVEPARHMDKPRFGGVIFRRTSPQITNEGGMWDESMEIYPALGAVAKESITAWDFPSGCRIRFSHLEYEKNKLDWKGAQVPYIGFDQLEDFSEGQFIYMLSRNRSTSGVKPYIRATCNPVPDHWLMKYISWWIDEAGNPIPERSGVVRWFALASEQLVWADSAQELLKEYPAALPKSLTFIHANIRDNKILMDKNPEYLANLEMLPRHERMALLFGNWKTRPIVGDFFKRTWVEMVEPSAVPWADFKKTVRRWDRAATKAKPGKDPDWTVGAKLAVSRRGVNYVLDMVRFRDTPAGNEQQIRNTAILDGRDVAQRMEQEPGSSGKDTIDNYARKVLKGYDFLGVPSTGAKEDRFNPFSSACQNGLVKVVRAPWNNDWFAELESLWTPDAHDDQADATGGAYNDLQEGDLSSPTITFD